MSNPSTANEKVLQEWRDKFEYKDITFEDLEKFLLKALSDRAEEIAVAVEDKKRHAAALTTSLRKSYTDTLNMAAGVARCFKDPERE